jgi:geranylgeranyl pyrophosphate synthase
LRRLTVDEYAQIAFLIRDEVIEILLVDLAARRRGVSTPHTRTTNQIQVYVRFQMRVQI